VSGIFNEASILDSSKRGSNVSSVIGLNESRNLDHPRFRANPFEKSHKINMHFDEDELVGDGNYFDFEGKEEDKKEISEEFKDTAKMYQDYLLDDKNNWMVIKYAKDVKISATEYEPASRKLTHIYVQDMIIPLLAFLLLFSILTKYVLLSNYLWILYLLPVYYYISNAKLYAYKAK
jgi:hypothetical protein